MVCCRATAVLSNADGLPSGSVSGTPASPRHVRDRRAACSLKGRDEVGDAIREGRAKGERERQLRAVVDHRAESMTEHVGPGDTLLVDDEPVDAGRVIVLRDRTDASNSG